MLLSVEAESDAEPELRVVLEQAVAPRRTTALVVGAVRRRGQVASVDAAATGGVGDQHVVAEQLGEELEVWRLATAGACTAELEQRTTQLACLHRRRIPLRRIGLVQAQECVPGHPLGVEVFANRTQVDALALHFALIVGRAGGHAQTTTGAIVGRNLHRQ